MTEENENQPKQDDPLITLIGGVEIEIAYIPSDVLDEPTKKRLAKFKELFCRSERVKVRQILVSQMSRYGNAILFNDEATAIEIYCGKEPGWADMLMPESVNAVADKGLEINLPFFSAWYRRQAKWKEVQTPQAIMDLQTKLAALEKTFSESLSRTSSEPSPTTTD